MIEYKGEYLPQQLLHCQRCKSDWWPRSNQLPKHCPKCNSPYWNTPRREGQSKAARR